MKKSWLLIGGIILFVLILVFWGISASNSLNTKEEFISAQLGNLNNIYQRRLDLIPNLEEIVKGSVIAERQTLEAVIDARSRASQVTLTPEALKDPQALANFQQAQDGLQSALSRLMVVVEKYPDLKSQANFQTFMSQIEGTENRIKVERDKYNEIVRDFNTSIRVFPKSIIAGMGGFTAYQYFQAAVGAENAPKVQFPGTESPAAEPATAPPPAPEGTNKGPARPAPAK
jgi:LemA protein